MALRIAVFTKNDENPNYRAFLHGAQCAAGAAGALASRHVPATPDDPAEQAALLRAVVAERPDAILFAPADDRLLEQPVAEASAAGIPLVGFANRMRGDFVSFVGADDVAMGRRIANVAIEALGGAGTSCGPPGAKVLITRMARLGQPGVCAVAGLARAVAKAVA